MPITLAEDTEVYRRFFASAAVLAAALDADGRVVFVSERGLMATGLEGDRVRGIPFWDLPWWDCGDVREALKATFQKALEDGTARTRATWRDTMGEERVSEPEFTVARDVEGRVKNVFVISNDTTDIESERRAQEEALRYGDALLRDANHRAMNSLAIVGSILRHERMRHEDPEVRLALDRLKARIAAISTLYRTLVHRPSTEDTLDARTYLEGVVSEIAAATLDEAQARIDISTQIADVQIPTDSAIPMGLILNELITNCAKYAFPKVAEGRIEVSLEPRGNELVLSVSDDGIGAENPVSDGPGLGGRLLSTFASQLYGEVSQCPSRDGGTCIEVTIGAEALVPRRLPT